MKPRFMTRLLLLGSALAGSTTASAIEYQAHGYAAQGYVYSTDNNFFGESSDGSANYYEAGLNTSVQLQPNLLIAAQGAIRDAGISDNGKPRLDYALVDYRFLDSARGSVGVRLGKVKNAIGFYNETRDVIFTRPSVLLPGVYNDNQNQRNLVFTSPGGQLYGSHTWGRHELSFSGGIGAERNVSRSDERLLIELGGLPFDLRIQESWNAQIMDSLDGGRWQFAISRFFGRFTLETPDPIGLAGRFGVSLTVFSARFNAQKFSVTAEYVVNPNSNRLTLNGQQVLRTRSEADTGYLQGEYRFNPAWSAVARIDAAFLDRHDRSGREFVAANPGTDRKSRMYRDLVLGVSWRSPVHWGAWAEYHWIDGTALLERHENPGPRKNRWSMILLMAGYRF